MWPRSRCRCSSPTRWSSPGGDQRNWRDVVGLRALPEHNYAPVVPIFTAGPADQAPNPGGIPDTAHGPIVPRIPIAPPAPRRTPSGRGTAAGSGPLSSTFKATIRNLTRSLKTDSTGRVMVSKGDAGTGRKQHARLGMLQYQPKPV